MRDATLPPPPDADGPPAAPSDPSAERAYWLSALAWQLECGADEAIAEHPVDRSALAEAPPPPVERRARPPAQGPAAPPEKPAGKPPNPDAARLAARALADAAADLPALEAALQGFDGSRLKRGARSTVFADGDPAADVMVVGEAPGRDEDRVGKPFVGRSGGLLDRMLAAIGLSRAADDPARAAYITNVIFYRPLENRTPDDAEVSLLLPFTERHIALARPKVILCLGNVPAKHLMDARAGITRFRGTWTTYARGGVEIPALATFHPAFLLRSPEQKRLAWRDLLSLAERLETLR